MQHFSCLLFTKGEFFLVHIVPEVHFRCFSLFCTFLPSVICVTVAPVANLKGIECSLAPVSSVENTVYDIVVSSAAPDRVGRTGAPRSRVRDLPLIFCGLKEFVATHPRMCPASCLNKQ